MKDPGVFPAPASPLPTPGRFCCLFAYHDFLLALLKAKPRICKGWRLETCPGYFYHISLCTSAVFLSGISDGQTAAACSHARRVLQATLEAFLIRHCWHLK